MDRKIFQVVDMNGNTIKKFGIERLAVAPANPKINQIYIDTNDNLIKQYDGTNWIPIGMTGAMVFKGTVGTGGDVTVLPTDVTTINTGDTYMVCSDGTYAGRKAVVGDLFVAKKDTSTTPATVTWSYIPSGNDKFVYEVVGDNVTTAYTITHTLNTMDLHFAMYDENDGGEVIAGFERIDASNVKVTFADAVPTGTKYKVVLLS